MERFYSWRDLEHCPAQGTTEALVICYNACVLVVDNVYRDVEEALKACDNLPDCVYVIGSAGQLAVFKEAWNPDNVRRESVLKRGTKLGLDFVKQYVFLEWRGTDFVNHVLGATPEPYHFDPKRLLTRGVYSLIEKNNVIHQAPSGHLFKHPSGNKNKVFIQAREIASGEAELFVIGYNIALRHGKKLREAKKVFVDTMGIYAYVMNALSHCGGKAEILSFHSYDELEKLYPPSSPYFCIISASTSGRMARKMKERWFEEDRIATMIDIKSADRCGDVMVPLDSMGLHFPELEVSDGTLIEIIGENFTSKAKPPRPVIIGVKHAPDALNDIHKYFGLNVPPFNSMVEGARAKLVQLDPLPILANADFSKWLDDEIDWSFSLAINLVIHANDAGSQSLAEDIQSRLRSRLANGDQIQLIPYKDLTKSICKNVAGVLVVSAVSRDGGVLREISRDLRYYIKAEVPRHFISPIGIPQTSGSWTQLEIFLTKNPTSRNYGFSNWIQMSIGDDNEDNVWSRLATLGSLAQGIDVDEIELGVTLNPNVMSASLSLAATEIDSASDSLLKSPRGRLLTLSEGFVFFQEDSEIGKRYSEVSQSAIFLTMSAVLQCAREHKEHSLRLCPTGYESVVLAPECFLRFNDPIIQACLLRGSLPSELDYSASPELSKFMKELLSKIFARCDYDYGDAALEFAASMAVGSLRLTRSDMNALFKDIFEQATEPSALLGLIILAKHKQK